MAIFEFITFVISIMAKRWNKRQQYLPSPLAAFQLTTVHSMVYSARHLEIPTIVPIYEPMKSGARIGIHGRIHNNYNRFCIELLSGPHVVLHVDFRFGDEHSVVLNAKLRGIWGSETRANNPLNHSDHYHVEITAHDSHYTVEVNGEFLADFAHRMPKESVQAIGFRGEGHITKVQFDGFDFANAWHSHIDGGHFGHEGWAGYGTEAYAAPTFVDGHPIRTFF